MKEIGELLKEAREEKGISLEEISKETKISVRLLSALEEGDFSGFAGKVYFKGALRNYAETVGIDARELFALYDRILERNDPVKGEKPKLFKKDEEFVEKKETFIKKTKKPFPVVVLVWIAVLSVVVGGSLWYRYEQSLQNNKTIIYPGEFLPEEEDEDLQSIEEKIMLPPEPEPLPAPPSLILLEGDSRGGIYIISGITSKNIELTFTGDCWISIEQDGNLMEQRIYRRGDRRVVTGGKETKIRLGNPPMALVNVNGNTINLAGINNPYNLTIRKE